MLLWGLPPPPASVAPAGLSGALPDVDTGMSAAGAPTGMAVGKETPAAAEELGDTPPEGPMTVGLGLVIAPGILAIPQRQGVVLEGTVV